MSHAVTIRLSLASLPYAPIMADHLTDACTALGVTPLRPLFDGGQKKVHVVLDAHGQEKVLKLIDLGQAADPAALERARREVDLLKGIDHPNLVKVVSDLKEIGSPTLAAAWLEEHLDGADLRHSVGTGWTADQLAKLGLEVASGLGALHSRHVIHRDLSPGNVRCLGDGSFKILDPGFAKHTLRSGVTVGGQPGTPGFMTPEHLQAFSGAPTPSSDVFGCGALVYFAASGAPPIPYKGNDAEYMQRLRVAQHVPLKDVRGDLPDDLLDVIERALHAQPARRYRNGSALAAAFGAL